MRARFVSFSDVEPIRRLPSSSGIMVHLLVRARVIVVCLLAVLLALPAPVHAYAVLSHEAIIDAAWETHIKRLLSRPTKIIDSLNQKNCN